MNDILNINDLKNGVPGAFEKLVETHQKKVINTCYRFLNNREDAEEIAQEVFIEVYKAIPRFREDAKISTWIFRISVNRSLNYIKKMKRKKRFDPFRKNPGTLNEIEQVQDSPYSQPPNQLEEEERKHILQEAMDSLPENQKTALILRTYDGFDIKEVAEIMGMSTSAVESMVHRARKNLQKFLFRYYKHLSSIQN